MIDPLGATELELDAANVLTLIVRTPNITVQSDALDIRKRADPLSMRHPVAEDAGVVNMLRYIGRACNLMCGDFVADGKPGKATRKLLKTLWVS